MSIKQLPFLFTLLIAVNLFTLKDGHNWGGDWGQYVIHAQNLLLGEPYNNGIMIEKAVVYPPGFPLLIAPVLKTFGLNFKALKCINIAAWYLSILFLFFILKRYITRSQALLCALFLSASSFFFVFKQNILSDIPFTLFLIAALWALESKLLLPSMLLIFTAILTRSAASALCIAGLIYFIFIHRNWRMALGVLGSSLAALTIQTLILKEVHPGFWQQLITHPKDTLLHLAQNASTVWQSMAWTLLPGETPLTSIIFTGLEGLLIILSPIIYLGLAYLFIRRFLNKSLTLVEAFCFIYTGMLFIWASNGDSPQNFARYTLPLIGFILMLLMQCANHFKKINLAQYFIVGLLCLNLINITLLFNFNDDEVVNYPSNKRLFAWIKTNTNPDDHYMTWEPRTVAVMTGRVGTSLMWFNVADPSIRQHMMRTGKIRYIILNPIGDKASLDYLSQQPWAQQIYEDKGFYTIFQLRNE